MKHFGRVERIFASVLIVAMMLMLAACPQQKSIADILRDPARYTDRDVAIKGTVVQSFGALGTGIYEVDDGTGKMWVFSDKYGVPSKGTRVGVAGKISPTATFAGRSFATVMRESERRR
ncbi:MAG TPA: hypothetical protein VN622_09260 [Clostridia bacterium]|nr:hypothetical protein [Clostridia bacterium]